MEAAAPRILPPDPHDEASTMSATAEGYRQPGYVVEGGTREAGRLRALWNRRGLLWSFTLRELQVRYRQAALGFGWALLQPIALTVVTTLVFHGFLHIDVGGLPYPVFAFTGLLAWSFFHTAVSGAVPTLVHNAGLVRKIWFPRETLPLATVLAVGLDLLAALACWVVLLLLFDVVPTWHMVWVAPLLAILVAFTAACALFGAAVNVRFRDVKHALPLLLQVLFFATPIVYPFDLVPPGWRTLASLNPLTAVVVGLRDVAVHGRAPQLGTTLLGAAAAALLLVASYAHFTRADRRFADVV
jgi:ABC-type polysaccharide/polyol phosphate export permease